MEGFHCGRLFLYLYHSVTKSPQLSHQKFKVQSVCYIVSNNINVNSGVLPFGVLTVSMSPCMYPYCSMTDIRE